MYHLLELVLTEWMVAGEAERRSTEIILKSLYERQALIVGIILHRRDQ